jgi:hypothetical protein
MNLLLVQILALCQKKGKICPKYIQPNKTNLSETDITQNRNFNEGLYKITEKREKEVI